MLRTNYNSIAPPAVLNIMIINGLFFMAQNMLPESVGNWMYEYLGLFFWESPFFRPWQFVTHMFLHGSMGHVFMNMFALWMFGRTLELELGTKRFLIYYFVTGIGAAVLHSCVNWIEISYMISSGQSLQLIADRINTVTIGASGAVFGVLLAFGMMHPNSVIMLLIPPIPLKAKYFVMIYGSIELLYGIFDSGSNIAHFAHVGGMLFGFLLLRYWKKRRKIYY